MASTSSNTRRRVERALAAFRDGILGAIGVTLLVSFFVGGVFVPVALGFWLGGENGLIALVTMVSGWLFFWGVICVVNEFSCEFRDWFHDKFGIDFSFSFD